MLSVREVLGLLGPGGYIVYKYIYMYIYIYTVVPLVEKQKQSCSSQQDRLREKNGNKLDD